MKHKYLSPAGALLSCLACAGEAPESSASSEPIAPTHASMPPSGPIAPSNTSAPPSGAPIAPSNTSTPPGGSIAPSNTSPPPSGASIAPTTPVTPSSTVSPTEGEPVTPTPPATDGFQLMWEDPFDSLDTTRWTPQTHSWDGNLAQFTSKNVAVVDGRLQMSLTPSNSTEKPYDGVEYRSVDAITYGKVEASMRFAKGSGVVSSLVLIYTPWPPDDWNELDIECLGNTTGEVQFNHMVNIPPADPISEHLQFPEKIDLGFDPTADFHTYTIEWLPDAVRFLVDGVVVHEPTEEISRLVLPQNILLTIWASDAPSWAGPIDDTTAPTLAEVDWIRVYSYVAP